MVYLKSKMTCRKEKTRLISQARLPLSRDDGFSALDLAGAGNGKTVADGATRPHRAKTPLLMSGKTHFQERKLRPFRWMN
jgi:hypothetical protein